MECFIAGVKTDSNMLESLIEEWSFKGEVILLVDGAEGVVHEDKPNCLFIPCDTPGFREVYYFAHQRMTSEQSKRFYHGFLIYGHGLLAPPHLTLYYGESHRATQEVDPHHHEEEEEEGGGGRRRKRSGEKEQEEEERERCASTTTHASSSSNSTTRDRADEHRRDGDHTSRDEGELW